MTVESTPLSAKARARADEDGLPPDHRLRDLADQFDAACAERPSNARRIIGTWARLRRAWCDYSGESLL